MKLFHSFFSFSFYLLLLVPGSMSWGREGHYAICEIAQSLLTADALAAVRLLLPDSAGGVLAEVCNWADEIRRYYRWRWTGPLHYIDTPDFRCNYAFCRDCHDSRRTRERCASGAIYNFTTQLVSSDENKYNLTEALMFLSHIMGDIHQPLHVGFTGDEGGNTISVHWFRRKANLHHVWDSLIIESAMSRFYNSDLSVMIEAIQRNISSYWANDLSSWKACGFNDTVCPEPYASESINLACKYAYKNATSGSNLGDEYFLSRLPVVEERLARGGVRLAATLNRIFSSPPSISKPDCKVGEGHFSNL